MDLKVDNDQHNSSLFNVADFLTLSNINLRKYFGKVLIMEILFRGIHVQAKNHSFFF